MQALGLRMRGERSEAEFHGQSNTCDFDEVGEERLGGCRESQVQV